MTTASNVTYTSPPPAYAEVTPAPKYTPKKDFSKAFGDLQGRYGCEFSRAVLHGLFTDALMLVDGGAPILSSKDKEAKPKSRTRTPSSSSTESTVKTSKKDFSKAFGELQGRYGCKSPTPHSFEPNRADLFPLQTTAEHPSSRARNVPLPTPQPVPRNPSSPVSSP